MRTRAARAEDAPVLGDLMVDSWLSAHRGQVPDAAWQKRAEEWTPDVSARGWSRVLAAQATEPEREDVLLVAEDDRGAIVGLVYGVVADVPGGTTGEIAALYVAPDRHREGIGATLLRAAAGELGELGVVTLRLSVLTANLPARSFYESMGGREVGHGTTDEEGHLLPTTMYEWPDVSVFGAS